MTDGESGTANEARAGHPGEATSGDLDTPPPVVPPADIGPAPSDAPAEPTPADAATPDRRPSPARQAAVVLALATIGTIAAVISATTDVFGLFDGGPTTTPPVTTTAPPPSAEQTWTDPFTDGRIDPERWALNARPDVIYERDDVLHLDASGPAAIGNADESNPSIVALPEGLPIAEFAFVLTLESITNDDSGGAGGAVFDAAGREHSAYVGPGGDVHHVEFATCVPSPQGEQCTSTAGPVITVGTPVEIRMVWSGSELQVYAGGSVPVYVAPAPTAPVRARFGMYADGASAFRVTVDDARLTYR